MKTVVTLGDSEWSISKAVERLLEKDEGIHPFVVIHQAGNETVFVQFAGSKQRRLIFDVPREGIVARPTTLAEGPGLAIWSLSRQGVRADDSIVILEHEDTPPPWHGELSKAAARILLARRFAS